ncbi:MAG: lipid A ABC transporter ATP-binding protein/permease MsbA [Pantoea sp. Brub]|nr:lipid A ABC transporter ATP-binding protein/permease MsbA [Pantoea sp. Brub]
MLHSDNLSTWHTFRRFWLMLSPNKICLCIAVIALIVNALVDILIISLLKPLLDYGFNKSEQSAMFWMPIAVITLILLRGITSYISNYCMYWVSGHVVMNMRRKLFNHLMKMPVTFFDKHSTGSLISRITYDSEQIASSSSNTLITLVRESTSILGLFVMMFYYSWQLSFILILLTPLVSLAIYNISKRFRHISQAMQSTMGQIASSAEEMLKGHKEILIFGGQKVVSKRFFKISNCMRQQDIKLVAAYSIADPIIQLIASLALVFILYIVSFPSIMKSLSSGTITLVFASMIALLRPLKSLTNVNTQFQRGMAACQTLFSMLDSQQEIDKGTIEVTRVKGIIEFKNVTFTYAGHTTPALNNINISLPKGKTIAFVGHSGSGKSTLVSLLVRFYDIKHGKILLDGFDIRDYKLSSLRNQIAVVSQNIYLFNDTIANNIAYACIDKYTRQDIEKAAVMAHAMNFIKKIHNGLDAVIGENGILLSGGQRQRIAIARALLRKCPILIFDEATSALDSESERAIQSALDELNNKNHTSLILIIAHRLSTVEKADEILVFENGNIVEHGTHDTLLLKKEGVYSRLHKIQFRQ